MIRKGWKLARDSLVKVSFIVSRGGAGWWCGWGEGVGGWGVGVVMFFWVVLLVVFKNYYCCLFSCNPNILVISATFSWLDRYLVSSLSIRLIS